MKVKICKCGHLRNQHFDKNPQEKYSTGQCNKCKCSRYLNRRYPNTLSKIMSYLGIGMVIFCIIAIPLIYFSPPIYDHWNDKTMPVSVVAICFFGFMGIGAIQFLLVAKQYFYEKRIRVFPIESDDKTSKEESKK